MTTPLWTAVCPYEMLVPERGCAALIEGRQLAIFRTYDGSLYALDNLDPISGANVLSRGIVGTRGEAPTVTSPMHKQVYDLRSGRCLDDQNVMVRAYPVRCREGLVEVAWQG